MVHANQQNSDLQEKVLDLLLVGHLQRQQVGAT
jgi:hypothetical protein